MITLGMLPLKVGVEDKVVVLAVSVVQTSQIFLKIFLAILVVEEDLEGEEVPIIEVLI